MTTHPDPEPDARELVEAILRKDARTPPPPVLDREPRSPVWRILSLAVVLVLAAGWNLIDSTSDRPAFSPEEEMAAAQAMIYLTVEALESYREESGSLPSSLDAIQAAEEGISYESGGGAAYRLSATVHGRSLVYREGDDLAPFVEAFTAISDRGRP